ncbi:6-pyruvoyl trahydropterin synthase family protein [Adhaeribacter soli]|uniref:6-carboxy-5,6,7,8-tetrahydropterin synthase n=1 Tax=Adhaeribacter soli TaxID=2607655 RepID=A0A5N1J5I7_9BACT|nr:6-carboxytetrahydropterin synthase [Adhaeribacter soli]KAA9345964.1 6-carboxytetrahydropterin synthase [Adhaeribacter soli]
MNKIRLSRIFRFETAHALQGYDGACRRIHGHSYKLVVTIIGEPLLDELHPKNGMVMDFGDLKKIVSEQVVKPFDHALLLNQTAPADLVAQLRKNDEKLVLFPYQPTCENMLLYIRDRLQESLPDNIGLHSLQLSETENSFAEWFAADNIRN